MKYFPLIILLAISLASTVTAQVESNVFFQTYASDGSIFNSTFTNNDTLLQKCNVAANITIIIHGWKESIQSEWTKYLIGNFSTVRKGCVIFMDYSYYSINPDFATLVTQFGDIQKVVTKKLQQLNQLGFNPDNFFMFGFSFGAHLVFEGAYNFGPRKVGRIDTCDPAGPYFTDFTKIHGVDAAKSVQCVHTSTDFGTSGRYCQKDVVLGKCGIIQDAATVPPRLSHGLCPFMYTSAFTNRFKLVTKMDVYTATAYFCSAVKTEPDVSKFAKPAFMGINLDMSLSDGQYYALTSNKVPYNVL